MALVRTLYPLAVGFVAALLLAGCSSDMPNQGAHDLASQPAATEPKALRTSVAFFGESTFLSGAQDFIVSFCRSMTGKGESCEERVSVADLSVERRLVLAEDAVAKAARQLRVMKAAACGKCGEVSSHSKEVSLMETLDLAKEPGPTFGQPSVSADKFDKLASFLKLNTTTARLFLVHVESLGSSAASSKTYIAVFKADLASVTFVPVASRGL